MYRRIDITDTSLYNEEDWNKWIMLGCPEIPEPTKEQISEALTATDTMLRTLLYFIPESEDSIRRLIVGQIDKNEQILNN